MRRKIFIGYAHQDDAHKTALVAELIHLVDEKLLEIWDAQVLPERTVAELEKTLLSCHTALLLVSRDFMFSSFVTQESILGLLRRRQTEDMHVIPIILHSCQWETVLAFIEQEALPKGGVPLSKMIHPKEEWKVIAKRVYELCEHAELEELSLSPTLSAWGDPIIESLATTSYIPPVTHQTVNLTHFFYPTLPLVGRNHAKIELDKAFLDKDISIAGVIAPSGVGKSALIGKWLERISSDYAGAQRVFGWSFYQQGCNSAHSSTTLFFEYALPFFGHVGHLPFGEEAKARCLVNLLRDQSCILVLDGIEVLQHPPERRYGECADVGLKTLLLEIQQRGLGAHRIVIISSRQPIVELLEDKKGVHRPILLENLSSNDSSNLLKTLGVKGNTRTLGSLAKACGGHALALILLGNLLVDAYAGESVLPPQIPPLAVSEDEGGQALRIVQFYDHQCWAQSAPERHFLQLLGLFDRPMTRAEWSILLDHARATELLSTLSEEEFGQMVKRLRKLGLILDSKDNIEDVWDTHPLIRQYFAEQFQTSDPGGWQQAHQILFEHFQQVPAEELPNTLPELEPLYRAVYHGCLAGEYEKALKKVYWQRILRTSEYYSTRKLGAFSADLATISRFFSGNGWTQPINQFSENDRSWLLAQASFYLMALGRLEEAIVPQQNALSLCVKQHDWKNAALAATNLVDLFIPLGRFRDARKMAQQAVDWATLSQDNFVLLNSQAKLGVALHCLGEFTDSLMAFWLAETSQVKEEFQHPLLYSVAGAKYCTLLLDSAKEVTDKEAVLERGWYVLNLAEEELGPTSIAFAHLTLGHAFISLNRLSQSQAEFESAVARMQEANSLIFMPEVLLRRANLYRQQGQWDKAQADLDEAWRIINRCGMRGYAVDAYLLQSHLLIDKRYQKQSSLFELLTRRVDDLFQADAALQRAEQASQQATKLIKELDYGLRLTELSLLVARIAHYAKRDKDAQSFLEGARQRMEEIGQWGLLQQWEQIKAEIG